MIFSTKNASNLATVQSSKQASKQPSSKISLGTISTGEAVFFNLDSPANIAIQGMTRSGKSVGTYAFLSRLVATKVVKIHCVDPTQIVAKPLSKTAAGGFMCLGTASPEKAVEVVEEVLKIMHERVESLWQKRTDKLTDWSESQPLHLLVLEELPSLMEWLGDSDAAAGRKPAERLQPKFLAGVRQIVAQGLKAGVCVLVLAQRLDASVISGPARSNIGVRICLRVDDSDAVKMLFPGASSDVAEKLATVAPGRGLVTTHEYRMESVRLDYLDYSDYLAGLGV